MWLINKAKGEIQTFAQAIKTTTEKIHPSFLSHPLHTKIDEIIKLDSNIVPLADLQQLTAKVSTDPDECQVLADILVYRLNRYQDSKSRGCKLFKTLVICDYVLLNGVSAFIDIFQDQLSLFQSIAQQQSSVDEEIKEAIARKAVHIRQLLQDKEKRLQEKEYLQQAKLLILERDKKNLHNTSETLQHEQHGESEIGQKKKKKKLVQVEKFLSKKFEELAIALIGLFDKETLRYIDSQCNKQFMERGESIIDEVENNNSNKNKEQQQRQGSSVGPKKQQKTEQKQQANKQQHKQPKEQESKPKVVQHANLLGIEVDLL